MDNSRSRSSVDPDLILDVNHVWKIYCRNLKRSMKYGIQDLARQMIGLGRDRTHEDLRNGEFFAVRDASFQIRKGECVAMIGPNGAGKSTMLKMVNGLIKPDSGDITIRGKTGALIELGAGFNPILSGRENIYINASVLGISKNRVDRVFDEIVEFAELGHVINDPIKTYSSGMRVRLGFSIAANLKPQLLIMDEVLAVGDVGFRLKCYAHLRKLIDEGVSIILVTHALGMLNRVATRSVVFSKGKIVFDGDLETGTGVYQELMTTQAEERKEKNRKPGEERPAWVDSVEVLDANDQPAKDFQTGDRLKLRIRTACTRRMRSRIVFALLSPVHGKIFGASSAYRDFWVDLTPEGNEITVEFDQLPLMIGAYYFNVSIFGEDIYDFHDRMQGCGNFRVNGPAMNSDGMGINGMLKLNHTWKR
ncbi:MAG: ABC transporter ATP-binding protein [Planctomycetota bacterium]